MLDNQKAFQEVVELETFNPSARKKKKNVVFTRTRRRADADIEKCVHPNAGVGRV